jgi:hypothetical protein
MAARRRVPARRRPAAGDEGQSLIEFLLLLPLLVGTVVILVRVNTAIQISIVNQQYARAQALFIAHHSPNFPRLRHHDRFLERVSNQMVIGVSENNRPDDDDGSDYVPAASTQIVARSRKLAGTDGNAGEIPDLRGKVRIRNTISLCTQPIVMKTPNGVQKVVGGLQKVPDVANATDFLYCTTRLQGMETLRP